jgi:hypothetical protein
MWLILMVLTRTLPTLAHADEYANEIRMLDLELSNITFASRRSTPSCRASEPPWTCKAA